MESTPVVRILLLGRPVEGGAGNGVPIHPDGLLFCAAADPASLDALAAEASFDVVIVDGEVTEVSRELLARIAELFPQAIRVGVGEGAEFQTAEIHYPEGGVQVRVLTRPLCPEELLRALRSCSGAEAWNEVSGLHQRAAEASRLRSPLGRLASSSSVGIFELDPEGRVRGSNASTWRLLGIPSERVAGASVVSLGLPCRRAAQGRVPPGGCAHRELTAPGTPAERALLWSCEAVRGEDRQLRGCVATLTDASEFDDLGDKIFRAKHELEAVFDSVTDPTFLTDASRRIVRANRALCSVTGKSFGEVILRPVPEVLGQLGAERVGARLDAVFRTGTPAEDELQTRDGRVYRLHLFPVAEGGHATRVVVRYQDVTVQRDMEKRLLQSEKMASIGQLSLGIAHEINNPMAFITWNLGRLGEYLDELGDFVGAVEKIASRCEASPAELTGELSRVLAKADLSFVLEDAGAVVEECKEGSARIQQIVRDLRTFSHPGEKEWRHANIEQMLDSTVTILWHELKGKCNLVKDYAGVPEILCRPHHLAQVFMNLLANAGQAMPEGGTLSLRTRGREGSVTVEVSDTGVGISDEHRSKIFDPFFTTKPVGKGTGLGLHIAQGVVREHGGEIRLESRPGGGTTFCVTLPMNGPEGSRESRTRHSKGEHGT